MYLCNIDRFFIYLLLFFFFLKTTTTKLISLRLDRTEDLNDELQSPLGNIDGRAMVDKVEAAKIGG